MLFIVLIHPSLLSLRTREAKDRAERQLQSLRLAAISERSSHFRFLYFDLALDPELDFRFRNQSLRLVWFIEHLFPLAPLGKV